MNTILYRAITVIYCLPPTASQSMDRLLLCNFRADQKDGWRRWTEYLATRCET